MPAEARILAIIPILSFIAWVPALVAIGLGIAGLVVKNKPRAVALIGLILGALAVLIGIVVSVVSLAGVASSIGDAIESAAPDVTEKAPTEDAPSDTPTEDRPTEEPATAAEWATETYGTFDPVTQQGSGDSIVTLPTGAEAGIVTATHSGAANFVLQVIDANNAPTIDLLVNAIGNYQGTTAFGLNRQLGEPGVSIQVSADGPWSITIAPVAITPEIAQAGAGDAVFLYSGDAAALALTHDGTSNFQVQQFTGQAFNIGLLVNEIGAYQGTVPISAGPSVVTIRADGAWTTGIS